MDHEIPAGKSGVKSDLRKANERRYTDKWRAANRKKHLAARRRWRAENRALVNAQKRANWVKVKEAANARRRQTIDHAAEFQLVLLRRATAVDIEAIQRLRDIL